MKSLKQYILEAETYYSDKSLAKIGELLSKYATGGTQYPVLDVISRLKDQYGIVSIYNSGFKGASDVIYFDMRYVEYALMCRFFKSNDIVPVGMNWTGEVNERGQQTFNSYYFINEINTPIKVELQAHGRECYPKSMSIDMGDIYRYGSAREFAKSELFKYHPLEKIAWNEISGRYIK